MRSPRALYQTCGEPFDNVQDRMPTAEKIGELNEANISSLLSDYVSEGVWIMAMSISLTVEPL